MADPLIEQIAQLVKTRLETITVANEYETAVATVIRPTRMGHVFDVQDLAIVLEQGGAEPAEEYHAPGNPPLFAWRQAFVIHLILRPSEKTTVPLDQRINKGLADIQKAMMSDPHWSNGTDKLALNTFPVAMVILDAAEEGYTVASVQFDIVYRTDEDDPYTQAP